MQLNHGRFRRANRGCGYLLKPLPLRDPTMRFNPYDPITVPPSVKKLTIKVLRKLVLPRELLCLPSAIAL